MTGDVVHINAAASPDHRVMRSHLVEFRAPGICGAADALRRAAAWLDDHVEPALLGVLCRWDEEEDETLLTLVVQALYDDDLERLIELPGPAGR